MDENVKSRKRTTAREIVVQLLYQYEVRRKIETSPDGDLDPGRFIAEQSREDEVRAFSRDLYEGTIAELDCLDPLLEEVVDKWSLDRLAAVDLAILRLAAFELKEKPDIPPKVVINEAIELAKKFSTEQSSAFVNGILDRLLILREGAEPADPGDAPLYEFGDD